MFALQTRTLWSKRKQFELVAKLSHDTNTNSIFGKDLSSRRPIQFGVRQGSILGPLLFVLYINDLPQCLENCAINMRAVDAVIYFTGLCSPEINEVVQDDIELQNELNVTSLF